MTPYIEQPRYKNTQFEDTEWGHFIDIDYGSLHVSNRYRSVTCPVIYGNKVYQKPYVYEINKPETIQKNRVQKDNIDNDNEYSLIKHPLVYITKSIIIPCINIFTDRKKKEEDTNYYNDTKIQTAQPLPQDMSIKKHQSLSELSCHNQTTKETTNPQCYIAITKDTYPIEEVEEVDDDYNEEYLNYPDKMNPSTMALVSFVSMCTVYMMF
tara:strand:+ start:850 stop:1479 length:630 start_codon:yes stop_codon:yes gene_type:complete